MCDRSIIGIHFINQSLVIHHKIMVEKDLVWTVMNRVYLLIKQLLIEQITNLEL